MDEPSARRWLLETLLVSRETLQKLDAYVTLLRDEAGRQNLVSRTTLETVYDRHIVDSAQLLQWSNPGTWLDLGSGAGLPGLVIAILSDAPVVLVESRRLRADWLARVAIELDLPNVYVEARTLESVPTFPADVITARAFAPLDRLFNHAVRFSTPKTRWILPKGAGAPEELASACAAWQGDFAMMQSVTHPESQIIVADNVSPVPAMQP